MDASEQQLRLYRLLVENSLGLMCIHDLNGQLLTVNPAAAESLGYGVEDSFGRNIRDFIHPAVRHLFDEYLERIRKNAVDSGAMRLMARDGTERIWLYRNVRYEEPGAPVRVLGHAVDVTERKRAEEALRASEQRLRSAQWAARIGTFEWDFRTEKVTLTPEMEALHGLPPGRFGQTKEAFENLVHPDDQERVIKLGELSLETGQPTEGEYRVVWPDGSVHWIAGRGQVIMDESGEPLRMVGVNMDVTERKQAEEALASMTRKLIAVQEQERARIGRELHDDINQQLALLAIDIEQLREHPRDSAAEISSGLTEIRDRVTAIAADVQSLAHQLHSPQLEILGIVAAMRGFCRELAARQKVAIDFTDDNIPKRISHEVSLCLFRVLQEALHNAVKHSKVRHYDVRLAYSAGEVHLTVSDRGTGFDTRTAMGSGGLGLVSMRERVRLVNGTITIDSERQRGTSIHVRVRIESEQESQRAAG